MDGGHQEVDEFRGEPVPEETFSNKLWDEVFATSGPSVKAEDQRLPVSVAGRPTLGKRAQPKVIAISSVKNSWSDKMGLSTILSKINLRNIRLYNNVLWPD